VAVRYHGHLATGGIDERIDSTLPPVLRPTNHITAAKAVVWGLSHTRPGVVP
jgi:hypothetical protein